MTSRNNNIGNVHKFGIQPGVKIEDAEADVVEIGIDDIVDSSSGEENIPDLDNQGLPTNELISYIDKVSSLPKTKVDYTKKPLNKGNNQEVSEEDSDYLDTGNFHKFGERRPGVKIEDPQEEEVVEIGIDDIYDSSGEENIPDLEEGDEKFKQEADNFQSEDQFVLNFNKHLDNNVKLKEDCDVPNGINYRADTFKTDRFTDCQKEHKKDTFTTASSSAFVHCCGKCAFVSTTPGGLGLHRLTHHTTVAHDLTCRCDKCYFRTNKFSNLSVSINPDYIVSQNQLKLEVFSGLSDLLSAEVPNIDVTGSTVELNAPVPSNFQDIVIVSDDEELLSSPTSPTALSSEPSTPSTTLSKPSSPFKKTGRRKSSDDNDDDEDYIPASKKQSSIRLADIDIESSNSFENSFYQQEKTQKKSSYKPCGRQPKRSDSMSSYGSKNQDVSKYRASMRERNNKAVRKCRLKRKVDMQEYEKEADDLHIKNIRLKAQVEKLEKEVITFRNNLFKIPIIILKIGNSNSVMTHI